MKKFSRIEEGVEQFDPVQLEKGIKIEKEHGDLYQYFEKYLESFNIGMPLSEDEFCEKIAKAHLRELPDYYDRLEEIESNK